MRFFIGFYIIYVCIGISSLYIIIMIGGLALLCLCVCVGIFEVDRSVGRSIMG